MKKTTEMGLNRTGVDASPIDSKDIIGAALNSTPTSLDGDEEIAKIRASYLREAKPIGTLPIPGTIKGGVSTLLEKLAGNRPELLIDKLGERLAFERTGTRLYEALVQKCRVLDTDQAGIPVATLERFRDQELRHFGLVRDALMSLGADPTAQTPAADAAAVASSGILKVVSDPRTSVMQSFEAILIAELADHEGWDVLIRVAEEMKLNEIAASFRGAYDEEKVHLESIRSWLSYLMLTKRTAVKESAA
ncbi:MAG TPA: ferritin-like domain-containing protein [Bdellovibrionota bacterium]|nr:ferritin-like domain-containing protein [Bdellovibrionota bacterium]